MRTRAWSMNGLVVVERRPFLPEGERRWIAVRSSAAVDRVLMMSRKGRSMAGSLTEQRGW